MKHSNFSANENGAMAIEAAVTLPVFLFFIVGIMFLGHAIMVRQTMFYALDTASREAMIAPLTADNTLISIARDKITGVDANAIDIEVTSSTTGGQEYKHFNAIYNYDFPQFIGLSTVTLRADISVPIN